MGSRGDWKKEGYRIKLGEGFEHRDGTEYIVDVFDSQDQEAAYFKFNHWINHPVHGEIIHVMEAEVLDGHRRKGIATAVYDFMEETLGIKIHTEPDQQTDVAKSFWASRTK